MRTASVIFAALLLAVPAATANWNYRGSNEPDTVYDDATWMFSSPDQTAGGEKVYFNGFVRGVRETHYNANVAILGSRMQTPIGGMGIMLGFWKDCNKDGYVGLVEQTMLEYRAEILTDTSVCPVQAPPSVAPAEGFLYPHNDGTWVRELIWIGPRVGTVSTPNQNPTNFYDNAAAAWVDYGAPGAPPTLLCPGAGNTGVRSTGALLDGVDCTTYYRGIRTLNDVETQTGLPVGGWEPQDVDRSDSGANVDNPVYPFLYGPDETHGEYRGHSGGFLGADDPEGEPRERLVTIADCESGSVDTSPSVATGWTSTPTNPATYPSAYESLNDTAEIVEDNGEPDPCAQSAESDGTALLYPHIEGYDEPTGPSQGRKEVDFAAEFSPGSRNLIPGGGQCLGFGPPTAPTVVRFAPHPVLGYCPPPDAGFVVERDDGPIGPAWRTNAIMQTYTVTTREGLKNDGEADLGAFYFTFYARVGAATFGKGAHPGGAGVYGSEACASYTSGVHGGWNCDVTAWELDCFGRDSECYKIGTPYNLRDVDCWDGTVARGAGVHASAADVSPSGPCTPAPDNEQLDLTFVPGSG